MNLIEMPVFQCTLLGRKAEGKLARPWKPEEKPNPFSEMAKAFNPRRRERRRPRRRRGRRRSESIVVRHVFRTGVFRSRSSRSARRRRLKAEKKQVSPNRLSFRRAPRGKNARSFKISSYVHLVDTDRFTFLRD